MNLSRRALLTGVAAAVVAPALPVQTLPLTGNRMIGFDLGSDDHTAVAEIHYGGARGGGKTWKIMRLSKLQPGEIIPGGYLDRNTW